MNPFNLSQDPKDKLNRARIFWKALTAIFVLTSVGFSVAYWTEAYGRSMDAKVIRLETEKAVREEIKPAVATSTSETTLPTRLGK